MNYFYYDKALEYPREIPYDPSIMYPESPFMNVVSGKCSNDVYSSIRTMFINMGLDKANIGKKCWNPLTKYISPGQTVLIKPNLVNHKNTNEQDAQMGLDCLITHPSFVRCLFDYVYIALGGKGKVIIADAPIQDCDFAELLETSGYGELFKYLEGKRSDEFNVLIADLRAVTYQRKDGVAIQTERKDIEFPGLLVDLGNDSFFHNDSNLNRVRITNYDGEDTVYSHSGNRNIYMISSAILEADVVISLPKPKTHRIAGYTAALKNFIGVNTRKEYLPHHKIGSYKHGGDEYAGKHRLLKCVNSKSNDLRNHAVKYGNKKMSIFWDSIGRKTGRILDNYEKDRFKFGMWYGNDTIWRTILDINHAVLYADKNGNMQCAPQRKIIYIGDMIVCGEGEGPLRPSFKKIGGILFSENAVEFDRFIVKIMGYKWQLIPVISNAISDERLIKENNGIAIDSNDRAFVGEVDSLVVDFDFLPTSGWKDYLKKHLILHEAYKICER